MGPALVVKTTMIFNCTYPLVSRGFNIHAVLDNIAYKVASVRQMTDDIQQVTQDM